MQVRLAKSAGFCFGVKRAIRIALDSAANNKNVYMLGDIVHNEDVVRRISDAGIKKIKKLTSGKNRILLIRAHGAGKEVFKKIKKMGFKIIDATCPMVKEIHRIALNSESNGYPLIIIGDKKHDEVRGIIGQLKKKAFAIAAIDDIPWEKIKKMKKACIVAQSTQDFEKVSKIVGALKAHIPDIKFFNTICIPTRTKQEEIRTMPKANDIMIIIGSRNSANTRRLYEISKAINTRSYWISSKKEIKPQWFKKAKTVGVTAGASTPDETTQEVVRYLKNLK